MKPGIGPARRVAHGRIRVLRRQSRSIRRPRHRRDHITPLVDVLLVLLIIFMVAAPVVTRSIDLDLPRPTQDATPPQTIRLGIDASGEIRWNDTLQPLSALEALIAVEAQRAAPGRQPLLQIDANGEADYGRVARVLAAARNAGLDRVAFVQR